MEHTATNQTAESEYQGPPFDVDSIDTEEDRSMTVLDAPAKPGRGGARTPGPTALAIRQVTAVNANIDRIEAGLVKLAKTYGNLVFDVTTYKGLEEAKAARLEIREVRYLIQNQEKAAKAPLNQLKAAITARSKDIIERIETLELPIDAQIKAEEKKKADEKAERDRIAAAKRQAVDDSINDIRKMVTDAAGQDVETIELMLEGMGDIEISLETFGDRAGEAAQVLEQTRAALVEQLAATRELVAVAERNKHEREELDRLREVNRVEEEQRQSRIRAENATRQAELDAQAEALAKQRKELDDLLAAQRLVQKQADDAKEEAARAERLRVEEAARAERAETDRLVQEASAKKIRLREEIAAIGVADLAGADTPAHASEALERMAAFVIDPEYWGEQLQGATDRVNLVMEQLRSKHKTLTEWEALQAAALATKRLNAGAPRMLAALRDCLRLLENEYGDDPVAERERNQARAAIHFVTTGEDS